MTHVPSLGVSLLMCEMGGLGLESKGPSGYSRNLCQLTGWGVNEGNGGLGGMS